MNIHKAALWSMGSQYIHFVLLFITSTLVSRFFLTPEEVGVFSIALSIALITAVVQDFGITRYLVAQKDITPKTLHLCSTFSMIFSSLVAVILAAIAWPMAQFYSDGSLYMVIVIIAASYVAIPWSALPIAILTHRLDFKSLFFINVGGALANSVICLFLAWQGFSSQSLAWAMVGQSLTRAIIAQIMERVPILWPISFENPRKIITFGSSSLLLSISGAIGVRSPDLIVGRLLGMFQVGLFSRAHGLAGQFYILVIGAAGGVFYPAFARLRDRGDDLAPHYERVMATYCGTIWPAMAMLALTSWQLVMFLYGETWAGVAPLLALMAVSQFFFVAMPLHVDIPILAERFRGLLIRNFAESAASIITLIIASQYSIIWAAASRIAYGMIWYLIYAPFLHDIVRFRWTKVGVIYAKSAALTLIANIPLVATHYYMGGVTQASFLTLIPAIILGCMLWLFGMVAFRHPALREFIAIAEKLPVPGLARLTARL